MNSVAGRKVVVISGGSRGLGKAIAARCLDEGTVTALHVSDVDGRNWERQYPQGRGQYQQ